MRDDSRDVHSPSGSLVGNEWLQLAVRILGEPTSPFHEHSVLKVASRIARDCGLDPMIDQWGNVRVDYRPTRSSGQNVLLVSAHADHPGFWADQMVDKNTLYAHWIGRVPEQYFAGQKVRFWENDSLDECPQQRAFVEGHIDRVISYRGEGDYALVEMQVDRPVAAGSVGQWALPQAEMIDGQLHATAIDDVAGVAALLCLLRWCAVKGSTRPITFLFTRGEEAGFVGCTGFCKNAIAAGHDERTQIIGIEMSKTSAESPLGAGPVIRVGDRRTVFDPDTTFDLDQAARRLASRDSSFKFQRRLMPGGTCESSVFQKFLGRAGGLCLPLGNYHNVNESDGSIEREFIDAQDFIGLVELLIEISDAPPPETMGTDPMLADLEDLFATQKHMLTDSLTGPF